MIRTLDATTFVSAQIQPDEVAALKAEGVAMIVCNRPDDEDPGQPSAAQIRQAAEQAGIQFRTVPISRGIGPSDVEAMGEAMAAADGKLLAYCRSGTRSAMVWALARREQGASAEEVEQAAKQAGFDLTPIMHLL